MRKFFSGHHVTTVQREGFGGMENGELLERLDGSYDVFILCDKNLRYQQNLTHRVIAVIELPTNRWPVLIHLEGEIARALKNSFSGNYLIVEEKTSEDSDSTEKDI